MKSSLTIVFATLLVSVVILAATSAFGEKCTKCYAKGGNGGNGGDGGWAKAGDVGPGGSCLAEIIGNECGVAQVLMNLAVVRLVTGVMEVTRLFSVVKIP